MAEEREKIEYAIFEKTNQIETLKKEIINLEREGYLLCDERQWFTEETEIITTIQNGKRKTIERLVGRINWNENFKDMDTDKTITVKRDRPVRINGEWI